VSANELRSFIEENKVDLSSLINNLVTTGEVTVRNLDGIEQLLVLYPYVVEGGFTVVDKVGDETKYNAHFGMVETEHTLCRRGYGGTDKRPPNEGSRRAMKVNTRCAEPPQQSNARGSQNAPRAGANYRAPIAGFYDSKTGEFTWNDNLTTLTAPGTVMPRKEAQDMGIRGKEAWKWLMLQPVLETE
jgi:phospholipid/cholesterol/gamma-HCH transport system substrate-binding protein